MTGHRCCSKQKVKRGLWSPEEDERLDNYITTHGHGSWSSVPKLAGLQRCGKSCRLRWINYLRPDLKRGTFSAQEEQIIIDVHRILGNRWAQIANHLPGRTDNEVKNFWNSCIKKKLMAHGLDPRTHNLIPARLRSHNHHLSTLATTTTTTKPTGSSQQPFSIITVKGSIPHDTLPESDPPASSMNLSSMSTSSLQDQNSDMLWSTGLADHGFPASWAPVVNSDEVHVQSAPATTVIQQQVWDPHGPPWGPPYNYTEGGGEGEGGCYQQAGAMSSDIRVEEVKRLLQEEEMIGIGTTGSSFDCFDPSLLSSSICRDLTSMDIIDLPWNF